MVPFLRASWRSLATTPRFDLALVAAVIVLAESEIWLPTGSCLGPGGLAPICNFGQSLGPKAVEIVYTTLAAALLLGRRSPPIAVLFAYVRSRSRGPDLGRFPRLGLLPTTALRLVLRRSLPPRPAPVAGTCRRRRDRAGHERRSRPSGAWSGHDGSLATFYLVVLGALPMGRALQAKDLRAELSEPWHARPSSNVTKLRAGGRDRERTDSARAPRRCGARREHDRRPSGGCPGRRTQLPGSRARRPGGDRDDGKAITRRDAPPSSRARTPALTRTGSSRHLASKH